MTIRAPASGSILTVVAVVGLAVLWPAASAPADYTTIGDGWDGPGQNPVTLGYYFANSTADLPVATQQAEILRAMNLWAKYADITWSPAALPTQNVASDFGWYTGDHGDTSPFDGPGGERAHAAFPAPPGLETLAGDVHFDDDETWGTDYNSPTNPHLFTVALHELGHALGLDHSTDTKAIMYEAFNFGAFGNALTPDDIAGIRSLYAARYPSLSAHVVGQHTWRSDLVIRVGVMDAPGGSVLWQTDVHLRAGGDRDDFDYDEIDLSEAAAHFDGSNDWFVTIVDVAAGDTGALDGFTIRYGAPGDWHYLASSETGGLVDQGAYTAFIYNPVPEPATATLLAVGALLLPAGALRRRARRQATPTAPPAG